MGAEGNGKSESRAFYNKAITLLNESGLHYMLGGGAAFTHHTQIFRDTKDLDIFCKAADCPRVLKFFAAQGFKTELTDARWLGKVFAGDHFIDIIFDSPNGIARVDESWFQHVINAECFGAPAKIMAPEELIFCKIYVQNRDRYDGADVNHVILRRGKELDWHRLLAYVDRHWQLLLAQIMNFQFVYPADHREVIPNWLFDELLLRARELYEVPASLEKVCRGPMLDQIQYGPDVMDWHYKCVTFRSI